MLKPLSYWILVILYAALIFYLSSSPTTVDLPGSDKLHHMVEFGLLSLLIYNALRSSFKKEYPWKIALLAMILTLFYGISDEIHQSFVPTRESDIYDVAADVSGAIIMQGIIIVTRRILA